VLEVKTDCEEVPSEGVGSEGDKGYDGSYNPMEGQGFLKLRGIFKQSNAENVGENMNIL